MRIAIIAGETSGDLLGAGLIRSLRRRFPNLEVEGIGGPQMEAEGCVSYYPMKRLSVIGLFEAFGRLPELLPVRARIIKTLLAKPPAVFIGVDAPDFNLVIASRLRAAGIKTVHYVSPSVWAWRRYRIRKITKSLDLMLVLFPFEADFYRDQGLNVEFVGHPLAEVIAASPDQSTARAELDLPPAAEFVALLPGSRLSEVRHLGARMISTAEWLKVRRPAVRFVAPMATPEVRQHFERQLNDSPLGNDIQLIDGGARQVMAASDVVLLASGTASLEAMLLNRLMVVTYRTTRLSYAILRRVVGSNISYVGLPNLLAGRELVPELLQDKANAEHLGPAVLNFLQKPELAARVHDEFRRLGAQLKRDASERAAEAITRLIGATS